MTLYENRDSTLSGAYWQYISSIFTVIAGALFYIFIIHVYSTQIVGVFALLSAIVVIFNAIFTLGLQTGVQHFISYHLGRREESAIKALVRKVLLIELALASASFATVWVLSPILATLFFHTFLYVNYLKLIDVQLFLTIFSNVLLYILLGLQSFKANSIMTIISWGVGYGLIIPLYLLNRDPIRILYAWIAGYALSTFILYYLIRKRMSKVNRNSEKGEMKSVFIYSIPIFLSSLIGTGAVYVDRFTVSFFLSLSELGIYNFSLLIVGALGILTVPFSSVLLSKLSEFYGNDDIGNFKIYTEKAAEIIVAFYTPIALLVAALSQSILLFLANRNYLLGTFPITTILLVSSLTVSVNIYIVTLQAIRKTRVFIISSALALLSNFSLSVLLIPRLGIEGAAIGYASLNIVSFLIVLYFSIKYGTFSFDKVKMAKIYSSGFLMFFLMFIIQDRLGFSILKLFTYLVTGIGVYLFLIRVMGVFTESDIDTFLVLIPKRFHRARSFFRSLFV